MNGAKLTCSVAMATYKGEKYVIEQLRSIEEQTIQPDEIIICDDHSPDNTAAVIREYMSTSSLNISLHINKHNLGYWKNFEKAVSLCTKDIVFFCDQDDIWTKNKVEIMIKEFEANENLVYAFTDAKVTDSELNVAYDSIWSHGWHHGTVDWSALSNQEFFETATSGYYPLGCIVAAKRFFLNRLIPFPTHHDKWVAYCAAVFGDIKAIEEKCIYYRRHSGTTTQTVVIKQNKPKRTNSLLYKITFALREISHSNYATTFLFADIEYITIGRLLQLIEENRSNINADRMKLYYEYLRTINDVKDKNCVSRILALRRLRKKGLYQKFRSESKGLYYYDCLFMFLNSFKRKENR